MNILFLYIFVDLICFLIIKRNIEFCDIFSEDLLLFVIELVVEIGK